MFMNDKFVHVISVLKYIFWRRPTGVETQLTMNNIFIQMI